MKTLASRLDDSFPVPAWATRVDAWQFDPVSGHAYRELQGPDAAVSCQVKGWEPLNARVYIQWFQGTDIHSSEPSVELLLCDDAGQPEVSCNLTASAARQMAAELLNAADALDEI